MVGVVIVGTLPGFAGFGNDSGDLVDEQAAPPLGRIGVEPPCARPSACLVAEQDGSLPVSPQRNHDGVMRRRSTLLVEAPPAAHRVLA
jgi:hypothetical protein